MDHKKTAPIDIIATATDHIRSITGRLWCAEDFEDSPNKPVDDSIATILNAVVDGQLILAPSAVGAAAPDLLELTATLTDALEAERAKVAAAYEAAAGVCALMAEQVADAAITGLPEQARLRESMEAALTKAAYRIRALTPADAKAALDKMLDEARLDGWRAGRDAATEPLTSLAAVLRKSTNSYHQSQASAMLERVDAIRALPEPKEASHD